MKNKKTSAATPFVLVGNIIVAKVDLLGNMNGVPVDEFTIRGSFGSMDTEPLGGIGAERFAFFDHEGFALDVRGMMQRPFVNYWYADSQGALYDALPDLCELKFEHIVLFTNTSIPSHVCAHLKVNGIDVVTPLESTHVHAMAESADYDINRPLPSILYIYDGKLDPMSSYYYGVMRHYNISQLFVEYPRY